MASNDFMIASLTYLFIYPSIYLSIYHLYLQHWLQSVFKTGYRLKRTVFMRSRFRQLAFRLLVFQVR